MKRHFIKKPVLASQQTMRKYTFYFGDGNSAASRGSELENNCTLSGSVSFDGFASAAVIALNELPNGFNDADILDALFDMGYEEDEIIDLQSKSLEDSISSLDISGGDPLVYKVEREGKVIYYDPEIDSLVNASYGDDDWDE